MQSSHLHPAHRIVYKGRVYGACRPPPLSLSCSVSLVPVVCGGGGDGGVQVKQQAQLLSQLVFTLWQVKQRKYLVKMKEDPKQVLCCGCC